MIETEKIEEALYHAGKQIAQAITDGVPGHDELGGTVGCLTEAVMGITAALTHIAYAIERLAEAVEAHD